MHLMNAEDSFSQIIFNNLKNDKCYWVSRLRPSAECDYRKLFMRGCWEVRTKTIR